MKYIFALISLSWTFPLFADGAFDASCFREVATLDTSSWVSSALVQNIKDDIFFVTQSGGILPSRIDSTEKNPPIHYSSKDVIDIPFLDDSDPYTGIEINPAMFLSGEVTYVFDLGKVYNRGELTPEIWFVTDRNTSVSISVDGVTFIPVTLESIENFDFRYFKIQFYGTWKQYGITRFHTLNFFRKIQTRYSFSSPGWKVSVFRSYACNSGRYQSYLLERPNLAYTEVIPEKSYQLSFSLNPAYRDDSDSDGHENLRDNCPQVSNPDQSDRNHDGIGDACDDSDGDNRFGANDNCPTVNNPDQSDKNVNGVWDACEFDTDGDGIVDDLDNAIHIKNPDQQDRDGDRIGDVMDNCVLYNPDQLDLDKNGKGDVCDQDEEYRKTNDLDKDGVLDYIDNCRKVSNSDQSDTDNDGIGNVCDNCRDLMNFDQADLNNNSVGDACEDSDDDGIVWWRDNCLSIPNADQKDRDNNKIWDACSDIDGDSIYDEVDNCPALSNKNQNDIDKDKIGDTCDTDDNRFLESNKYIFMTLIGAFALLFIGGIILLIRKLQ